MQYYYVEDIKNFVGCGNNKAYAIIRNLNKKFKVKYPDCEIVQGKVLKWFYDEAMGMKGVSTNEEVKH